MNVGVFVGALGGASVEFSRQPQSPTRLHVRAISGRRIGNHCGFGNRGVATAFLGTGLQLIPLRILQVVIGLVLLWFGWGWVKVSPTTSLWERAGWVSDPPRLKGFRLSPAQGDLAGSTSYS
jgi:uncharacterized membrane protein